jgi:hypothetical protein
MNVSPGRGSWSRGRSLRGVLGPMRHEGHGSSITRALIPKSSPGGRTEMIAWERDGGGRSAWLWGTRLAAAATTVRKRMTVSYRRLGGRPIDQKGG